MSETLQITPGQFSLDQLRAIHQRQPELQLDAACRANIENSARTVSQIIADQRTVYGINTGFGLLARTSIPEDSLVTLQRNLILSHCTGTGPLLDDASVALIMALKIGSLARGFSGVGMAVIDTLLKLYQARVYPCIPSQGSVGASGDLAPLAHMSSALIGVGQVRHQGRVMEASEGLAIAGCQHDYDGTVLIPQPLDYRLLWQKTPTRAEAPRRGGNLFPVAPSRKACNGWDGGAGPTRCTSCRPPRRSARWGWWRPTSPASACTTSIPRKYCSRTKTSPTGSATSTPARPCARCWTSA